MSEDLLIGLARESLFLSLQLAGPLLAAGLVVGVLVSVFQAVTQVQETSLSFIPKAIVVGITFVLLVPWMIQKMVGFTVMLFGDFTVFIR